MQYIAIRRSLGFRGRSWEEGEVVDVQDGETVPHHFIPLSQFKIKAPMKDDKMAPRPMSFGNPIKTQSGFAAKINPEVIDLKKPNALPESAKRSSGRRRKQ